MRKSNYISAVERIGKIKDFESLDRLGKSFDRLYRHGIFTVEQFLKLDDLLMHKSNVLRGYELLKKQRRN
jgi:hypothetical protein